MPRAPLSSYLFAFIFTLTLDKPLFLWYIIVVKDKKTFKATLASGEVMTFKAWGMCWAASKTVDLDVVKIEECSLLEWAKHQTLQPNKDLQVICG